MSEKYKLCLRLNEEERERLERDAQRCGLTRNAYLRRLITGSEVRERPNQEIKALRTEIHQIGNNINQFTRICLRRKRGGRPAYPAGHDAGL